MLRSCPVARFEIVSDRDRLTCRWLIVSIACLVLSASLTHGRNLLRGLNDTIILATPDYVMWGIELDSQLRLPDDPALMFARVRPWVTCGVNSVGFSLQHLDREGTFFSPDGKSSKREAGVQFTRFMNHSYSQHLGTVVSLFSAEPDHWLASADAYRNAAHTIATMLPQWHSTIFVVGDLFGTTAWAPECPYPMNEPDKVMELCRIILKANPEAIVAIPASIVERPGSHAEGAALFYAASDVGALEQSIAERQNGHSWHGKAGRIAVVDAKHFLCRREVKGDIGKALRQYTERVERERLAIHQPSQGAQQLVPDDILTAEEKSDSWLSLFDGRTLDSWTTLVPSWGRWSVEEGAIRCRSGAWPYSCLSSRNCYASFILQLDYRIAQGGNSGITLWSPLDGRPSRLGLEVQLIHTDEKRLDRRATTGAIYGVLAPREDASKPPGEWNHVEIACRGSKVTVTINDRIVQDFDADEIPQLQNRLRKGRIRLQDHGSLVRFRNIKIKILRE